MASVSKSSWHYRLHSIIRRMWGNPVRNGETRSLCPYFHITFWGTILTAICLPLVFMGWAYCKSWRLAYKSCYNKKALRGLTEFFDAIPFSKTLDNAVGEFEKAPVKAGLEWFARLVFFVAVVVLACLIISFFFFGGLKLIPEIPGLIVDLVYLIGQGIFWIFFGIGWTIMAAWEGIGMILVFAWGLVVDVYNWFVPIFTSKGNWAFIGKWAGYAAIVLSSAWAICATVLFLISWKRTARIRAWFIIRANGYMQAREDRAKRLEQEMKDAKIAAEIAAKLLEKERALQGIIDELDKLPVEPWNPRVKFKTRVENVINAIFDTVGDIASDTKDATKALYAKEVRKVHKDEEGNTTSIEKIKVLGPVGVLVAFLWSIKKGVCPVLEFVDEDDLKDDSEEKLTIIEKY